METLLIDGGIAVLIILAILGCGEILGSFARAIRRS